MTRKKWFVVGGGLAGAAVLAVVAAVQARQFPGQPGGAPADRGKFAVELPAKQLLAFSNPGAPQAAQPFVNPKVEPGKVKWHPDLDAACKAAAATGRPVLLFHLMGKLDDQFC
jgi:hypothetical protein